MTEREKRLVIYTFFDPEGEVREYVVENIKALKEISSTLIIVVNGEISDVGKSKIEKITKRIIRRKNIGYDFSAWRQALFDLGFENVENFNELILTNCSCYGPVFPYEDSFSKMEKEDCDFWGYTEHPEIEGIFKRHLQSNFIVIRKRILCSQAFKQWWKDLEDTEDWISEVLNHEVEFTDYLEKNGFKSRAYYNNVKNKKQNPCFFEPLDLLDKGVPLIKRKLFRESYSATSNYSTIFLPTEVLDFVRDKTGYDEKLIIEDIIKTTDLPTINKNLSLLTIIDDEKSEEETFISESLSVAAVVFVYYDDQVSEVLSYLKSLPINTKLFVVSSKKELLKIYEKELLFLGYQVEVRVKENRGRDVAAYLVTCRDIFQKFDLICCIKDKKTKDAAYLQSETFSKHLFSCTLNSRFYVKKILEIFEKKPYVGLIIPPPVNFGTLITLGNEWAGNKAYADKLCKELNIKTKYFDEIIAAYGSMFWIRKEATKTIFKRNWKLTDFPEEPLPLNGSISHAVERLWTVCAQNDGYLPMICIPKKYASLYFTYQMSLFRDLKISYEDEKVIKLGKRIGWKYVFKLVKFFLCSKLAPTVTIRRRYRMKFESLRKS